MDAQDLEFITAVAATLLAGKASRVVNVGFHAAAIASMDIVHVWADLQNFHSQFMAGDARVTVKWKLAQVATQIRTANTDAVNSDQGLARPGGRGFLDFHSLEAPWFLEHNSLHDEKTSAKRHAASLPDGLHRRKGAWNI